MASTFTGYNIAVTGMAVNQSSLAVVSSNVTNVNTTGYSRKQVGSAEQVVAQSGGSTTGTGVRMTEVVRARNTLLDQTYRQQNADLGYWEVKEANLEEIQETLSEFEAADDSSDRGLQQTLTDFFNSWEELAKDPSSQSSRQSVVENAMSLLSIMQDIDEQLEQLQLDAVAQVQDGVAQLNALAQQVADLNRQITQLELNGGEAGDLRDQRDSLLDTMSGLANIKVQESGGVLEVSIGGVSLVRGDEVRTLETEGDGSAEHPLQVLWTGLGDEANITSGTLKAYLEDCDRSGVQDITSFPYSYTAGSASSISNLRQGLNDLMTTIANQINELHASGTDLDGDAGLDFFVAVDSSQPLSLSNMQVNPEIVADVDKIVTSVEGGVEDSTIAEAIYHLTDAENFVFDGLSMNMNDFYQSLISWVATTGDTAGGYCDTQSALVQQTDTQRQSVSSVSLDEEMTKLMMYQNAYSANARVLSTVDSLLAELIEDLGS
jgi:flagellar hook-associated protein 1 FlgK